MAHTLVCGAFIAALAACGGGGNESGPPDDLAVSPASYTQSWGGEGCYRGKGPKIFIYGGQPPYEIFNPLPQAMTLSTQKVEKSGDNFQITFINGWCMDNIEISIEDRMGTLAKAFISNQPR